MKKNGPRKQDLPNGFNYPSKVVSSTLFPFQNFDEFVVTLEVSKDELNRWFERGWISFDPEKQTTFDEAEYLEVEFIKSLVQSGQPDEWIEKYLSTLEKPYSYNIRRIAYSFAQKCWVQALEEEDIEKITDDNINSYLNSLTHDELEELKVTIEELLENNDSA